MSPIEILGFLTGVANVWLLARQNLWNWPVGLANNALYLVVFLESGLYGDAGLQVVYMVLGLYGWWTWTRRGGTVLEITRTPRAAWFALTAAMLAGWLILRWFLANYTDSVVPGWDGLTTAMSLAAIYGQCRKYVESWWLWIAADVIYIPLYGYKNLWLTSALYAVFLALCVVGLRDWRRALKPSAP